MSRLAIINTRARVALQAPSVVVEVHLSAGLPALNIVGLPETSVRESKDRVRSALINSGYEFPEGRITVNLAPADLPKEGSRFDLPIALGILIASGQLPEQCSANREFLGELALSGCLRPVTGVLPASIACGSAGLQLIVPEQNAGLAAFVSNTEVIGSDSLQDVCRFLTGKIEKTPAVASEESSTLCYPDISDVKGQQQAKRALQIAAAGGHHLLLFGPPGTGKTMLASRLPGLLPPLTETEALEVAAIHSLSSGDLTPHWQQRPFRSPHHTSSAVSIVGGGSFPQPGEITFAHRGVLFLDEMPEFQRSALEILREPLESGEVVITRARGQETFPAQFQLVAAMNPCPCGYLGDMRRECRCSAEQVARYRHKISGPLLDRIDLQIEVASQNTETILNMDSKKEPAEITSNVLREKVIQARHVQFKRQGKLNTLLNSSELKNMCQLNAEEITFITRICDQLSYSARAIHRILRVARTIADIEGSDRVTKSHLAESIQFRKLDRQTQAAKAD